LTETEPSDRFRSLLPCIASLVETKSIKEERQPILAHDVDRLTAADLDALADVYAATLQCRVRADRDAQESPPQREPDEASTAYVDRVLKYEFQVQTPLQRFAQRRLSGSADTGAKPVVRLRVRQSVGKVSTGRKVGQLAVPELSSAAPYNSASENSSVSVISITDVIRTIDMIVGFVAPRSILLMCARSISAR
jgi:hypothetical protein